MWFLLWDWFGQKLGKLMFNPELPESGCCCCCCVGGQPLCQRGTQGYRTVTSDLLVARRSLELSVAMLKWGGQHESNGSLLSGTVNKQSSAGTGRGCSADSVIGFIQLFANTIG